MKKLFVAISILVILTFLMVGCGDKEEKTTAATTAATTSAKPTATTPAVVTPKFGGTLNMIQDQSPRGPGGYIWEVIGNDTSCPQLIFEPLFRGDNQGALVPWLATAYKLADDHSSVTFTLRQGVKFSDGSDLNAEVAKWCFDRSIAQKQTIWMKSAEVVDAYTVKLNLAIWNNTIIVGMGNSTAMWMVSKAAFDKAAGNLDEVRLHPVGTGPFLFDKFAADAYYDVVRNPNYWKKDEQGKQLPYLDGVHTIFSKEITTRVALMQSGGADVMAYEPGKQAKDLANLNIGLRFNGNVFSNLMIFYDTANPASPWADIKVRQAVEYAMNRDAIAEAFGYGYWKAAYQLAPETNWAYDPNYPGRKYDLAKAKQLMKDAGKEAGFSCTAYVSPQPIDRDILVTVQDYLSKINITLKFEFPDGAKEMQLKRNPLPAGTLFFTLWGIFGTSWNGSISTTINPYDGNSPNQLKTDEYKKLYDATINSPLEDHALVKALIKYIDDTILLTAISGGGKGWAERAYVMGAGWNTRGFIPWWTFETCWLNK